MKKLLVVLLFVMATGLAIADDYEAANAKDAQATVGTYAIVPLSVEKVYNTPVFPIVIANWTRQFTTFNSGQYPFVDNNGFSPNTTGDYGWVFKLTKQAGPGSSTGEGVNGGNGIGTNYGLDPYRVSLKISMSKLGGNDNKCTITGRWFLYEIDNVPPTEVMMSDWNQTVNLIWYADETEAHLAFFLQTIDASQQNYNTSNPAKNIVSWRFTVTTQYSNI